MLIAEKASDKVHAAEVKAADKKHDARKSCNYSRVTGLFQIP